MAFSFLNEENIFELYEQSKTFTEKLTVNFPEHARIVRNRPHPKTPKRFPKTTDGTTAAITSKSPKRVVQQLPTGVFEAHNKSDKWAIIADFMYREEIVPNANAEHDLIQKCWTTLENGMAFGSQVIQAPLLNHGGKITPDYINPYWGNVFYQPGKKSGPDGDYTFIRDWWQEGDVDQIIETETERKAEAKAKGKKFVTYWDLDALEEIKQHITKKDDSGTTEAEKDYSLDAEGIEVVTGYQKGTGNIFYSFNPVSQKILRRKPNKDPRGSTTLSWYYFDTDGSNPAGRSLLDLVAPLQNLIDSDMQAYQYNRALALQPPMKAAGNFNKKRVSFAPNAVNDLGTDPNAIYEPMTVDTSAIRDYPNMYGLQKSQLMGLTNGDPATAVSAEVGDPLAGKTPTAIKARSQSTSVDDNAMRKGFEASFEDWSETAVNLLFAERTGKEEQQLDAETADKLRELEEKGIIPVGFVSEDNKIIIDYDEFNRDVKQLHFRINASTSKVNSEAAQLESLQILVQTLDSSPSMNEVVPIDKKLALWNAIAANSGVEESYNLRVTDEELEELEEMRAKQQAQASSMESGEVNHGVVDEMTGEVPEAEMPVEDELPDDDTTEIDEAIMGELRELGVPEDLITEVPEMLNKGYTEDEVMAALQGVLSQGNEENEEVA